MAIVPVIDGRTGSKNRNKEPEVIESEEGYDKDEQHYGVDPQMAFQASMADDYS